MELRLVVHRSLTISVAALVSLVPVLVVLAYFWPRLSNHLHPTELLALFLAMMVVSLLVPPTRDFVGRLLDRYVYRTHANYQRTVREASRTLTRVLDLKTLLAFIGRTLRDSTACEGVIIYLLDETDFRQAMITRPDDRTGFACPESAPAAIVAALAASRDVLVTDDVAHAEASGSSPLHETLARLNWALVLPVISENALIGLIAVGPKLSGDAFYPHDIDLLMTLANQAGVAIKNAQLYAEVVLAHEYIENILATINSGVVAVDSGGRITMFNPAAERLTGLVAEAVRRQPIDTLPRCLAEVLRATVADGQSRTEPEVALPGGSATRPVICTTSPLRTPDTSVLGAVTVFNDLTPLKELERERRRAERLAYFETLASSIAHEIKNPLVAVQTFAQLLPRRQGDPQFVENFGRVVTREVGRMERLVERLRRLSRSSDGPRQRVDIRGPILEAVEFLQPAFGEKRVALATSLGDEARCVVGDQAELEQLFLNLLMNAHEATPADGEVSVELATCADRVVVTVADTGPGIAPELLEHVFDAFFTTKQRGSGLGLTICAGIAAAHHAKLRAANRPGGGALFTVEFAAAAPVEASART